MDSFKVGDFVTPKHTFTTCSGLTGEVKRVDEPAQTVRVEFPGIDNWLAYAVGELVHTTSPHPVITDTLSDLDKKIADAEATVKVLYAMRDAVAKVRV
jgi:hypothetical protein